MKRRVADKQNGISAAEEDKKPNTIEIHQIHWSVGLEPTKNLCSSMEGGKKPRKISGKAMNHHMGKLLPIRRPVAGEVLPLMSKKQVDGGHVKGNRPRSDGGCPETQV